MACDRKPAKVPSDAEPNTAEVNEADSHEPVATVPFTNINMNGTIPFTYDNGEASDQYTILESLGGGIGTFDYDLDGRVDFLCPGGGQIEAATQQDSTILISGLPTGLFRQLGNEPLQTARVDAMALIDSPGFYTHGVTIGDSNNDGFQDAYITGYNGAQLFENMGDGTFQEVASEAGLSDPKWSASAAWGDINRDGLLELYIANYVDWSEENNPPCPGRSVERDVCPPRRFDAVADQLNYNQGDGTFSPDPDVAKLTQSGKGLGVLIADLDLNGTSDIYVGNDTVANFFLVNNESGKFEEKATTTGIAINETGMPDGSMGVALLDYNFDNHPDLWVSNYENESSALYRNEGRGLFLHSSRSTGITAVGSLAVGWGTVAEDFDLDGDEDVFVANGHVIRHPENSPLAQLPFLFMNNGYGRFESGNDSKNQNTYLNTQHRGRGCASCDFDRDGDMDLIVSHIGEPIAVLQNEQTGSGKWLQLRLIGTQSSRDGFGAVVTAETSEGKTIHRQLIGGGSYASSSESIITIGTGHDDIMKLSITWPSGATTVIESPEMNRRHDVVEENSSR